MNRFSEQDISNNKVMGIVISFFPILFFIPMISGEEKKNSPYLKFRSNQALVIFVFSMICTIISNLPLIGFVGTVLSLVVSVLSLINFVYACMGSDKPTPLIGTIEILK